ncbi:MAG: DUF4139 domain-containing protein [Cryomorphaceae bacterium]
MQKSLLLIALFFSAQAIAQEGIAISSVVESVTVYPRGAQIERSAAKFLSAGRQLLTFTGLASELDPASIGVSASGSISVLSVSSRVNHLKQSDKPKAVRTLEDSLATYVFDQQFNQNMLGVYAEERKMILANQKVGWEHSEFLIEDLEDLSDFYRDRLADVMLKEMELQAKQERLTKSIARLKLQLNESNSKLNRSTGEIVVEVQVPSNASANFTLTYMVRNAGWTPAYNVNVSEVDRPLQVSYNAKVYQNTGIDWKDVSLTLTNANPNLSGVKPEMHPWRLYYIEDPVMLRGARMYSNTREDDAADMPLSAASADNKVSESYSVDYPVNDAVTRFRISTKHNVPSNGKPQVINIDVFTMPAKYEYYAAPKMDPTAFLIARVSGFEQYDLLPGQVNLFLSNTYVGQTFIDPSVVKDTLDLSLGRDQSIVIKREKIKEFSNAKKIGNSTKQSLGIMISVRNTKATKVQLVIEDQVPISSDKDIVVSLEESSNAKHEATTGKLRWTKVILGNSTESVQFKYDVKYPSDKKINL